MTLNRTRDRTVIKKDVYLSVLISPGHGLFVEFRIVLLLLLLLLLMVMLMLMMMMSLLHHLHLHSVRRSEFGDGGTHGRRRIKKIKRKLSFSNALEENTKTTLSGCTVRYHDGKSRRPARETKKKQTKTRSKKTKIVSCARRVRAVGSVRGARMTAPAKGTSGLI